MVYNPVSFSLQ